MTVFKDPYGKQWKQIHFNQISIGDIVAYGMGSDTDFNSGWFEFHHKRNYSYRVKDPSCPYGVTIDILQRVVVLKLEESEPYDPSQEPEDDCI